ncbi:hypothetical protein SCHPADRAFT_942981 [Schizopora paradoxa]|uniref:Uncharacterized protein n=1 Tax=Schizopora paradoxa TaxID=27342 RepID=A0A0H2REL7_9AGAM|nr:hypothetical protein SCHPADRAFT_942981 [Schizopora paradoxa]
MSSLNVSLRTGCMKEEEDKRRLRSIMLVGAAQALIRSDTDAGAKRRWAGDDFELRDGGVVSPRRKKKESDVRLREREKGKRQARMLASYVSRPSARVILVSWFLEVGTADKPRS